MYTFTLIREEGFRHGFKLSAAYIIFFPSEVWIGLTVDDRQM